MPHRHRQGGPGEKIQPAHAQSAQHRNPADRDAQGNGLRAKRRGVHHHEPGEPVRQSRRGAQADAASPVMPNQRHVAQVERFDQAAEIVDVLSNPVVVIPRLVREPHAEMIDRHAAVLARQPLDDVPPGETPGRIAMHEQQRRPAAFVNVGIAQPVQIVGAQREGIFVAKFRRQRQAGHE